MKSKLMFETSSFAERCVAKLARNEYVSTMNFALHVYIVVHLEVGCVIGYLIRLTAASRQLRSVRVRWLVGQ